MRDLVRLSNLVSGLLVPAFVLGQGAPDIVWSRSDHTNAVNSMVFSSDGIWFASGSSDRTIRIYRAADGNPIVTVTNGTAEVLNIALTTIGTLVSWDSADVLRVWQIPGGSLLRTQAIPSIGGYGFSATGDLFAAGGDIWSVADGNRTFTFSSSAYQRPVFSPNGELLGVGLSLAEEYEIEIWRLTDGLLLRRLTNYHSGISLNGAPVFLPDSTSIAVLTGPYGATEIWAIASGSLRGFIPEETASPGQSLIKLLVFMPNGTVGIMSDRDDKIRMWRIKEGQEAARLALYDAQTAGISALAMSPKAGLYGYGRQDGKVFVARVPVFITEARLSAGQFITQWLGGSGLYQLQQSTNLSSDSWDNVGSPTTNTDVTNNVSGGSFFYRVQSLPN